MAGIVIGIDPSLTGLAVCGWRQGEESPFLMKRFMSASNGTSVNMRMARYCTLTNLVLEQVKEFEPEIVFIEGYSFASPFKAAIMGEFGGVLRLLLDNAVNEVIEIAPSAVKKFATGKGAGKKELVMAHVERLWKVIYATNDEADAHIVAAIGMAYQGYLEPKFEYQREVIEQLKNPAVKKHKGRKSLV